MLSSRLLRFTDAAIAARRWQHRRLGPSGSQVLFDLLALAVRYHLLSTPSHPQELTIKLLIGSLPYSEAGVRKALRQCVADGWVCIATSPRDGRVRVIRARPKLVEAWREYETVFTTALQTRHGG